jgi:hypothetical protein
VPERNTQFRFKTANFNFHSISYAWLIIAGPNAKFKGVGTINGEGEYWFMVSASDADLSDEISEDTFRIKIKGDNGVIYDNQMGDGDDADAIWPIGGGSIVIHN